MSSLNQLTVAQAYRELRGGQTTARALVQACLDRIERREPQVKAWFAIDPEHALMQADRCDAFAQRHGWLGVLHGIPLGIKDIFDVAGFATGYGSDAWPPGRPEYDAVSVGALRDAGAIMLGKTVSTAFAMGDAGPTCNPWNTAHTPGGSSSGSAAAVADQMCFAALGTQTVGSVLRPAAFNGLIGFKPGYDRIETTGVQALSWQLDHIGVLARSVEDANLFWQVLRRDRQGANRCRVLPDFAVNPSSRNLRLMRIRDPFDEWASPAMRQALDSHSRALAEAGHSVVDSVLPEPAGRIGEMHQIILASEAAAVHAEAFEQFGNKYPPNISQLIQSGQQMSATDYLAAQQYRTHCILAFEKALEGVDGLLLPAAAGAAPKGLASTGDRRMNAMASFLGLPAICYPIAMEGDLPIGAQIINASGGEDALFRAAQ